jgi:hypothetical protein
MPGPLVIVACRVMEPELEYLRKGKNRVEILYLDQGLHRTPRKMADRVQELIDEVRGYAGRVVLGYGLCSNGIVGVKAREQGLVVPRCHDCIAFFLGSIAAYKETFETRPGTYYLTPGWVAEKKDPLGIMQEEYVPKFGTETAQWVMEEELKHYTHIALIDTGVTDIVPLRRRARQNADYFKKEYDEIKGKGLDLFVKLLSGAYDEEEFFFLEPGETVTQEMFLESLDL